MQDIKVKDLLWMRLSKETKDRVFGGDWNDDKKGSGK